MEDQNETEVTEFILVGLSYQPDIKIVLFVIFLVVFLVSLTANSLFIIVTLKNARLHSPMYFFLCNLALLDLCYSSACTPTVLEGLLVQRLTVTISQCMSQMFLALTLGQTECFLLTVMAWDRYVAICNPLYYQQVLGSEACVKLASLAWIGGFCFALLSVVVEPEPHFCGHNIIDQTFCELSALSRLTCKVHAFSKVLINIFALFGLGIPLSFILFTYFRIIAAILRMPPVDRSQRSFTTCGSHLVVVSTYYGTGMVIYLFPRPASDVHYDKSISLFYAVVSPALHPLLYNLRNREVRQALKKLCKINMS